MKKALRLQARDYDILNLLNIHKALSLDMIDRFIFLEPGKTRSRCWDRLDKLRVHSYIARVEARKGVTVFLLTAKGKNLLIKRGNFDPRPLWLDPEQIENTITHWEHHLVNCELGMMFDKAVDCLNSLHILEHSDLPTEIRETAKQYIRRGWSRNRVFTALNHLLYLEQSQKIANPTGYLRQAIETNKPKPKGFSVKTFRSSLDKVDLTAEGYQILNWKNDLELSRLTADQRLQVEYTPLYGQNTRSGQVEADQELTIAIFNSDNRRPDRAYTLMLEYDSGSRPLELSTIAPADSDDNSFSTQIRKKVAMLESKTYQRIRGQKLDRIAIVCDGGPKALENRVQQVEKCGGKQKFMLVSLDTLRRLKDPGHVLTAPIWRRCGETTERYYPLIGTSYLDRCLQKTRRTTKSEEMVSQLKYEIYESARREMYVALLSMLSPDELTRLSEEKGSAALSTWLNRWYSQRYGPTYFQSLAIFADLEAERKITAMK